MRAQIAPKTEIARATCHGCGGTVTVKANKNGMAYYFCPHFDASTGAACQHHEKWGRARSEKMLSKYLTKRVPDQAANTNAAPEAAPEEKQKGEWDGYFE